MGRRLSGDRFLVVAGLVLVVGAIAVLVWLSRLAPAERNDAVGYLGFALGLAGAVATLWGWLRRVRRPVEPRPVDTLTSLLAKGVHEQWRKAAVERVLLTPPPIPVRWSLSNLEMAGPLAAAVGVPDEPPAFRPLPRQTMITQERLQAGGGRRELFAVYAGIASGRVVVVGAPGAGKSGTAILLLLDALEHREQVDETDRTQVPVPVLFTAHGWDPNTSSVQDWLCARLAGTYPLFQHRGGHAEAATLIGARDKVALILDGLDEMDEGLRPAALTALGDVPFRVVVLTRSHEMVQATRSAWLVGAVAMRLDDVTRRIAADYLQRAPTGPSPSGWGELLTHLRGQPNSVLTRALSTPLTLTLIRDTYRAGDDVSELLDASRYPTAEHIEQHLIARVLPDAYTARPGRPPPRYNLTQATQALSFIARQMNQHHTRDFAWWHIPLWAPATPRILGSMLASGLLGALAYWLVDGLLYGGFVSVAAGLGLGIWFGLAYGRGGGEPKRVRNWRAVSLRSILPVGLAYGIVFGIVGLLLVLVVGLTYRLVFGHDNSLVLGLMFGIAVGLPFGLAGGPVEDETSPDRLLKNWRKDGAVGLVAGLIVGLMFGLKYGLMFGLVFGVVGGLVFGLAFGLMRRLAVRFVFGLVSGLAEGESRPLGPLESWRNDRVFGLAAGLAFGLAMAIGVALFRGLVAVLNRQVSGVWLVNGLTLGLALGVVVGLVFGITSSVTWPTTIAWLQLQRSRRVPVIGLMPFLEDAQDRGVLRTVGAAYQFRHATLQDQLTGPALNSDLAASSPASRTS